VAGCWRPLEDLVELTRKVLATEKEIAAGLEKLLEEVEGV
jgi:type II secretory pathway component PulM